MVDRRAISLHALAGAALVILLLQLEAAARPGFQMSFAATAALVALAELWPRPVRDISEPVWIKHLQGGLGWIGASIGVSFIAGLAAAPVAMQSFNRISTYGLPANLITAPLSSFVFMPAIALGAVLTPLDLGRPVLNFAAWSLATAIKSLAPALDPTGPWTASMDHRC